MKVTREELIYIHKRIWNDVLQYIHDSHGKINRTLLFTIRYDCIDAMINENEISQKTLKWVYMNSGCVFCTLFSEDCNKCPIKDCTLTDSLYRLALEGSEEACIKIRDSIYYADIPEYIEIPEE